MPFLTEFCKLNGMTINTGVSSDQGIYRMPITGFIIKFIIRYPLILLQAL